MPKHRSPLTSCHAMPHHTTPLHTTGLLYTEVKPKKTHTHTYKIEVADGVSFRSAKVCVGWLRVRYDAWGEQGGGRGLIFILFF